MNPLFMIAAQANNRIIGDEGEIPWHLPDDLRRFKAITYHHPIIMGRKTYDSIGDILYGRRNIILTRNNKKVTKEEILKKYYEKITNKESKLARQIADMNKNYKTIKDTDDIDGLKSKWGAEIDICNSIEEVFEAIKIHSGSYKNPHDAIPFVAGGRQIYKQFMPYATRLFITLVHRKPKGDIRFPTIKSEEWKKIDEEEGEGSPSHTFLIYERK